MKWIYKIATLCLFAFVIVSCAKHDFFDEMVITGDVAPESYWQDVSQVVKAGDSLSFNVQYYTNNSDSITHLEAWYSVTEKEEKSVSCPLITSFVFDMTSTENTVRRVSQMIRRYEHDPSCWSDSLHAYEMNGYIPVSSTLAPTTWPGTGAFDSLKMSQYFGISKAFLVEDIKPIDIFTDEERKLMLQYRSADQVTQEMVKRMLRYKEM